MLFYHKITQVKLTFYIFQMGVCFKEYRIYNDMIPSLNKARRDKGLEPLKAPKCFYASSKPDVLIMENLKIRDFVMRKSIEDGNIVMVSQVFSVISFIVSFL